MMVPENRKVDGLFVDKTIRFNVSLPNLSTLVKGWLVGRRREQDYVADAIQRADVRPPDPGRAVEALSGGNQQKVVLAKWLATEPRLLIFDEPTRGIDVGAKAGIHDLIRGLANEGVAVVPISSELPEVIGMSDRIVVMRHGEIAGEVAAGASEAEIMFLATGERDIAADAPTRQATEEDR